MEKFVLDAEQRTRIGKRVKALRREGKLPAILYGKNIDPIPLTLNAKDANKVLGTISSSQLVIIKLGKEKHTALVRDRQRNPIYGHLTHVDLLAVSMTEKLRTNVPVELVGEPVAVRELGGLLVTGVEMLEVESLPGDLPDRFTVDVSEMANFGDTIAVRELNIPPGVDVLTDQDEVVAVITIPRAVIEEEEEEVEEEALEYEAEEPEVIERGKTEEEEF